MILSEAHISELPEDLQIEVNKLLTKMDEGYETLQEQLNLVNAHPFIQTNTKWQNLLNPYKGYLMNKLLNFQECIEFSQNTLQKEKLEKDVKWFSIFNLCSALSFTQKMDEALKYSDDLLNHKQEYSERLWSYVCFRRAYILYFLNDRKGAAEWFIQTDNAAENENNIFLQANACSLLGAVYINIPDYERAIPIAEKAHKLFLESGYKDGEPGNMNNLGEALIHVNKWEEAEYWLKKSYEVAVADGIIQKQIYPLMNLAALNLRMRKTDECLQTIQLVQTLCSSLENKTFYYSTLILQAEYFIATENYETALQHILDLFEKGIPFDLTQQRSLYEMAYQSAKELNNWEIALSLHEKFHETDHRMMEEARNKELQQLNVLHEVSMVRKEKANSDELLKMKSRFLAVMSHEIRTPLNSVFTIVQLLQIREQLPFQKPLITTIENSVADLNDLLSDALDLSKLENKKMELNLVDFSLTEFSDSILNQFSPIAETKNLKFFSSIENTTEDYFVADISRIKQIVKNLCSNAIKFTEKGNIKITYELKKSGSDYTLFIRVTDTGKGMNKTEIVKLFKSYSQTEAGISAKYGGTGLGLNISYELAKWMQGDLVVESQTGVGSTFTLSLPVKVSFKTSKTESRNEKINTGFLRSKKILVADDHEINLNATADLLNTLNEELVIYKAKNGVEAIQLCEQFLPDLVLVDAHMPVMDGYEFTQKLKTHPKKTISSIPVVGFTAGTSDVEFVRFKEQNVKHIIPKPFKLKDLISILSYYLRDNNKMFLDEEFIVSDSIKITALEEVKNSKKRIVQQMELLDTRSIIGEIHKLKTTLHYAGLQNKILELKKIEMKFKNCTSETQEKIYRELFQWMKLLN